MAAAAGRWLTGAKNTGVHHHSWKHKRCERWAWLPARLGKRGAVNGDVAKTHGSILASMARQGGRKSARAREAAPLPGHSPTSQDRTGRSLALRRRP